MASTGSCPHCSKPISMTAKFCTSCGKKIEAGSIQAGGGGPNFSKEYEEEKKKNALLEEQISRLGADLGVAQKRIATLERDLQEASNNSSSPPPAAAPPAGPSAFD